VEFPAAPGVTQTWKGLKVPDKGEATYYFRMQRWSNSSFTWPPAAWAEAERGSAGS
jgi:hypothetical protein